MKFGQDYFDNKKYNRKQQLIERHVLEVLRWASKETSQNLLDGYGKRALDVGCALGFTSRAIAKLGYETIGTDISNWGIKQAKDNVGESDFLVADAQAGMPFNTLTFDLVTCFDVLEHLDRPETALAGLFEICRGSFVCTTPNSKVEKPIRTITGDYDRTHINVKSVAQWQQSVNEAISNSNVKLATFFDCPLQIGGKLFFKSFHIPKYGLTVRMAVKK